MLTITILLGVVVLAWSRHKGSHNHHRNHLPSFEDERYLEISPEVESLIANIRLHSPPPISNRQIEYSIDLFLNVPRPSPIHRLLCTAVITGITNYDLELLTARMLSIKGKCHWALLLNSPSYANFDEIMTEFMEKVKSFGIEIVLMSDFTSEILVEIMYKYGFFDESINYQRSKHVIRDTFVVDNSNITPKFILLMKLIPILNQYDYVWILDSDIWPIDVSINSLVDTMDRAFRMPLYAAQPIIRENTRRIEYLNYESWLTKPSVVAQETEFIESQTPIFNSLYLEYYLKNIANRFMWTAYATGSDYGLDVTICSIAEIFAKKHMQMRTFANYSEIMNENLNLRTYCAVLVNTVVHHFVSSEVSKRLTLTQRAVFSTALSLYPENHVIGKKIILSKLATSRRLRILIMLNDYKPKDTQIFLFHLARSLNKRLDSQTVIVSDGDGSLRTLIQKAGIQAYIANPIAFILENYESFDVFHFNTIKSCDFINLPNWFQKPIVYSIHESISFNKTITNCSSDGLSAVFSKMSEVTFTSEALRLSYQNYLINNGVSSSVIYGGIETLELDNYYKSHSFEESRKKLNINNDTFVVLVIGSVESSKGQLEISIAVSELVKKYPSRKISLYFLGEFRNSDYNAAIRNAVGSLPQYVGPLRDPKLYYRTANVNVIHATSESIPYSIMESSMMRVPNIAKKVFSIPELIDHEITGFLYEKSSDLVNYLEKILLSNSLQQKLGENAAKKMYENFNSEKMSASYFKLYKNAIENYGVAKAPAPIEKIAPYSLNALIDIEKNEARSVFYPGCKNPRLLNLPQYHRRSLISYHLGLFVDGDSYDVIENNLRMFLDALVNHVNSNSFYVIFNVQGGPLNPFRDLLIEYMENHPSSCVVDWKETRSDIVTHALTAAILRDKLNNFYAMFGLNQNVRGPFANDKDWISRFVQLFNNDVKYIGASLSCESEPHIQTHMFGLHYDIIHQFINHELYLYHLSGPWKEIVKHAEIGFSRKIIKHGHKLASMLHLNKFGQSVFPGKCSHPLERRNPTGWCNLEVTDAIFVKYGGHAYRLKSYCPQLVEKIEQETYKMTSNLNLRIPEYRENFSSPVAVHHQNIKLFTLFYDCVKSGNQSWCPLNRKCISSSKTCFVGPKCGLPLLYNAQTTGITNQLLNIRDLFSAASSANGALLLGPILYRNKAQWTNAEEWKNVSFYKIYDYEKLLLDSSKYGCVFSLGAEALALFSSRKITTIKSASRLISSGEWNSRISQLRKGGQVIGNISDAWASYRPTSTKDFDIFNNFASWFHPAKELQPSVSSLLAWIKSKSVDGTYYGIHLRTEGDWSYGKVSPNTIVQRLLACNVSTGSVLYIAGGHDSVNIELELENEYFKALCTGPQQWKCYTKKDSKLAVHNLLSSYDLSTLYENAILTDPSCRILWGDSRSTFSMYVARQRLNMSPKLISSFYDAEYSPTCQLYKREFSYFFNMDAA